MILILGRDLQFPILIVIILHVHRSRVHRVSVMVASNSKLHNHHSTIMIISVHIPQGISLARIQGKIF